MEYGRLKIELMQRGVRLSDPALEALPKSRFNQIVYRDYPTTGGLVLKIAPDVYANCPVDLRSESPFTLNWSNEGFSLSGNGANRPVEVLPPPLFALENKMLASGDPVRNLVMAHADRARIMPIYGCAFHCEFCNAPRVRYRRNSIESLDAAFRIALEDPLLKPRHTLISGGTPESRDEDFAYLDEVYRYFPDRYPDMDFDLMLAPRSRRPGPGSHTRRKYKNYIKFLHECGVKGLSINLELYGDAPRKKIIREKEQIGRENYFAFIELAVERFGPQRIRSCLVVGLESPEDTLAGVEEIARRGCMPVLSPFIPAPGTFLAREKSPSPDFLERLLFESKKIVDRHGVELGPTCKACCHNNLSL